jgi:hypothetical protein
MLLTQEAHQLWGGVVMGHYIYGLNVLEELRTGCERHYVPHTKNMGST